MLTHEEKLEVCKQCTGYRYDKSGEIFLGLDNSHYCVVAVSLIRPMLLVGCPEEKW
jgi:hypothetical protein